jgi:dTMP kinase
MIADLVRTGSGDLPGLRGRTTRTMTERGRLIVFEGAEGTGKSTQIALLMSALSAATVPAVTFREPGGTSTGDAIRAILLDPSSRLGAAAEALLFMASRAELCEREIRPALERGLVVVLDRFFLSTYAYQIVGRGLDEAEIRAANRLATGGLVPDLTLLLNLHGDSGLARAAARGARDRMEQVDGDFHRRVADAFRAFTDAAWIASHPECGRIVRVDATGSRDDVFVRVMDAVAANLPGAFPQAVRGA